MISNKCHIISVCGGKGGLGKSLFSANLALAMQKEFKLPCLLIDLDNKSCGDQNIILGTRSRLNIEQFSVYKQSLNAQNLKNILGRHPSSGLSLLSAVLSSNQRLTCDLEMFKKQLFQLSQFFNYIFVDIGCEMTNLQNEILNQSSVVLMVVTPEILTVNQSRRILNELSYLPSSLFYLILNKDNKRGLNPQLISKNFNRPFLANLPEDPAFTESLHNSTPFILQSPQSLWTKNCYEIVRKLINQSLLQKGKSTGRQKALPKEDKVSLTQDSLPNKKLSSNHTNLDPLTLFKLQIHSELIKEMDLKKDLTQAKDESAKKELRNKTQVTISRLVDLRGQNFSRQERNEIIQHILDEALGLGVLEQLLSDSRISEIMVNGCNQIFFEKNGKLELSHLKITSNRHLRNIIERIVTPLGRRIDEKTPYVDARLEDGSRVNAIIEPLALDGPSITIRKFPTKRTEMNDLIFRFNSLTEEMGNFLKICVEQGLNIVISGGTGSGKTTLLNVLSSFIPESERIITIEDAAELQLKQIHVVRLETRPPNIEGEGEVSIRDLIKNSLRMRPDRIVVGECRDGAALDMLSAMNTGHDGSLTTVHANNPREAVARLETLCLMAGMDLPAKAIREQIAGAIDMILQISRLSDGSRKVKNITEVVGMQGDVITLQEVFRFKEEGFTKTGKITGQFQASGIIPSCIEKLEKKGLSIPRDLFMTKEVKNVQKPVLSLKPKIQKTKFVNRQISNSANLKKISTQILKRKKGI
ncbi:MAG: Flp pilus assembly complex ATPase component TadA [Bdellovibrionales bacterium]|nr:Flp pilus assembly complex ATPase component TadA [Bdellovibrionales bacterium]